MSKKLPGLLSGCLLLISANSVSAQDHSRTNPYRVVDRIGQAISVIETEYYSTVDQNRLAEGALKGLAEALDPHSHYFNAQGAQIFRSDTQGEFGGIGVEVDFVDGRVIIIQPIEGSPAARAKIAPGDQIISVDAQPVEGKKPHRLVELMRGEAGTFITLTLRKAADNKLRTLRLQREVIKVNSVKSAVLEEDVIYLRIKAFQSGTTLEVIEEIGKIRERLAKSTDVPQGLILDLRNNPGGLVREATGVANEFLSSGTIFSTRHREQTMQIAKAESSGSWTSGPLVVLVNEYSASAAELVAGALKDHKRALIVGARTFGKGSVQTVIPLSGGAAFKLTTALYFTPSGRSIQATGIVPDVEVDPGYQQGSQAPAIREKDLDGHITQTEQSSDSNQPPPPQTMNRNKGSPPTNELLHLGVAREIPLDPENGPDSALKIAYQIIMGSTTEHLSTNPVSQ